ncbi:hypothetical protein LHGZ1_2765 [Laribacter hongkongensis]|uniref:Uncharacterized protein n=1 Tax=Laribacter hongkongensis TaxID=168471 RepID=A0A248LMK5_9NEIS|nr:hypothetical protein LHGZ1_2765 [Laribacter hongkongensis]
MQFSCASPDFPAVNAQTSAVKACLRNGGLAVPAFDLAQTHRS